MGFYMPELEFEQRLDAMNVAQLQRLDAAIKAFRPLADGDAVILPDTPELVSLTAALEVSGFDPPVLLYPGTFAVRTRPGDFARAIAGITGTRYRCVKRP